jgi:small subunit ribosomal protein S19
MSRSKWKGPFLNSKFIRNRINKNKIWCRSSVIPNFLVGSFVFIHRGNSFKKIFINREKVGFKFGEFSPTRLFIRHKEKSKNLIKKKK